MSNRLCLNGICPKFSETWVVLASFLTTVQGKLAILVLHCCCVAQTSHFGMQREQETAKQSATSPSQLCEIQLTSFNPPCCTMVVLREGMGLDTNQSEHDKSECHLKYKHSFTIQMNAHRAQCLQTPLVFTVVLHKWVKQLQLADTGVITSSPNLHCL